MQYLERAEMADLLGTYLPTKFCLSNSCNYLLLGLATVVVDSLLLEDSQLN